MVHHTDPCSHCGAPRPNIVIEGVLDEFGGRQRTCLLCARSDYLKPAPRRKETAA